VALSRSTQGRGWEDVSLGTPGSLSVMDATAQLCQNHDGRGFGSLSRGFRDFALCLAAGLSSRIGADFLISDRHALLGLSKRGTNLTWKGKSDSAKPVPHGCEEVPDTVNIPLVTPGRIPPLLFAPGERGPNAYGDPPQKPFTRVAYKNGPRKKAISCYETRQLVSLIFFSLLAAW
jgi:hypothetical protein